MILVMKIKITRRQVAAVGKTHEAFDANGALKDAKQDTSICNLGT